MGYEMDQHNEMKIHVLVPFFFSLEFSYLSKLLFSSVRPLKGNFLDLAKITQNTLIGLRIVKSLA